MADQRMLNLHDLKIWNLDRESRLQKKLALDKWRVRFIIVLVVVEGY